MIYEVFYLIRAALILALPLTWLVGAYSLIKKCREQPSSRSSACFAIVAVALMPFLWVGFGWLSFSKECASSTQLTNLGQINRPKSILMKMNTSSSFGKDVNIQIGPILGEPVCVERELIAPIGEHEAAETGLFENWCGTNYSKTSKSISQYALSVDAETSITGLGYVLTYRVQSLGEPSISAESKEFVFGRGLLSSFIGLFSGSNNPEYLACGYVNKAQRIWRSTRSGVGYPEYEAYKVADQKLFYAAMSRAVAR